MHDVKQVNLENDSIGLLEKLPEPIKKYLVYPVQDFISKYSDRISRSYAFAKLGWKNYDFDSQYLFEVMSFKLKRIREGLKNGCAIQENEDMSALQEAIDICERLFEKDYNSKYHELHNKKWGEMPPYTTELSENSEYRRLVFHDRTNVKTEADRELERTEFLHAFDLGELDRRKDLDRLNYLFKEYLPKWWD